MVKRRCGFVALAVALAFGLAACSSSGSSPLAIASRNALDAPAVTVYSCATSGKLGALTSTVPTCAAGATLLSWAASADTPSTTTTAAPTTTSRAPTTTAPANGGTTLTISNANYPQQYGTCGTIVPATSSAQAQLKITIASACNPGGDGHYRTDWSNKNTYAPNTGSCTSIPVDFPNGVPSIGSGSWWQIAEAKTPSAAYADWGLYVVNGGFDLHMAYVGGGTTGTGTVSTAHPEMWKGGDPTSGWNTFVVCSNYSTTSSGYLNLYLNGVLVRALSGVPIVKGSDDLDINDYTGGSPANVTLHGAPEIGSTLASVEQPGGWNSAP